MKPLTYFAWILLGSLCSLAAYRTFSGWSAWVWVPGAFIIPWIVRSELEKRFSDRLPMLLCITLLLLTLLSACATRSSLDLEEAKREQAKIWADHRIWVETIPPGAIVDWNNDVAGISPCYIVIPEAYRGEWPGRIYHTNAINARWTDGTLLTQTFAAQTRAPKHVVFLHPNPRLHTPQPLTLK